MCVRTASNIAVVNRGNAAPKVQRNTVATANADAVYILADHQRLRYRALREKLTSTCLSCSSGEGMSVVASLAKMDGLPRTKRTPS